MGVVLGNSAHGRSEGGSCTGSAFALPFTTQHMTASKRQVMLAAKLLHCFALAPIL
jgi:hypothetical protein